MEFGTADIKQVPLDATLLGDTYSSWNSSSTKELTSSLDEFRMSANKVELPPFLGDGPVAWVTRAKTYFEVHYISNDVQPKIPFYSF